MRRPITALAGTLAGIALLIGLKFGTSGPPIDGVQASSRRDVPAGQEQRPVSDDGARESDDDDDDDDDDESESRSPRTRRPQPGAPGTDPTLPGVPDPGTPGVPGVPGDGTGGGGTGGGGTGGGQCGMGGGTGGGTGGGGTGGGGTGGGGTGGGAGKSGTFAGAPSSNEYGTIRVTVTVSNGKLTNVAATFPTSPSTTAQINARAIPKLKQEALAAQSARIATVSGATFTSSSYRASLQSALSKAGI